MSVCFSSSGASILIELKLQSKGGVALGRGHGNSTDSLEGPSWSLGKQSISSGQPKPLTDVIAPTPCVAGKPCKQWLVCPYAGGAGGAVGNSWLGRGGGGGGLVWVHLVAGHVTLERVQF